jgi:hypothetical protein
MRIGNLGVVCAALVAAIVTSPALAAPENPYGGGTRIPQHAETIDRGFHESRVVLQQFAHCTMRNHADDVQKYLLEDLDERETGKLREKILNGNCLVGAIGPDDVELHLIGLTLQGSLAEEMLAREGLLSQPIDVVAVAPLHHSAITAESLRNADADAKRMMIAQDYLFRFGECVVRANVPDTYALLKSKVDSPDETAAFTRLMPAFGSCVEKNRTLTGDKTAIRAAIAYNYYKLAKAPRVPSPMTAAKN